MTFTKATVLEPNRQKYARIADGLKKAGLKVAPAAAVEELQDAQLVVIGTSARSPSRLIREIREVSPNAFVMAAQAKGFKAPWADAVLPLPVSPNDVRVRLAELDKARSSNGKPGDGILDPATNFYTFAHFKEVLFVEVKRARRYGFPLALALIAFDPVKGKMTPALQSQLMSGLSLSIRRSLRDTDYPVQYSADRVLLLMPHTDLAGSLIVARRVCERVAKATVTVKNSVIQPTISIGVAAGAPGRDYEFSHLVRQANDGLTSAMVQGGNRVEFYDATEVVAHSSDGIPKIPPVAPLPTA